MLTGQSIVNIFKHGRDSTTRAKVTLTPSANLNALLDAGMRVLTVDWFIGELRVDLRHELFCHHNRVCNHGPDTT